MLALAEPVDAEIIYVPAHRHITLGHAVSLDLNGEGVVNLKISVNRFKTVLSNSVTDLDALGARQGNSVAGYYAATSSLRPVALALDAGRRIGPSDMFVSRYSGSQSRSLGVFMAGGPRGRCSGPWNNVNNRYLGLKFRVDNRPTQYGWARLNVSCSSRKGVSAVLTGYAYETIPNKTIVTGKTEGTDVTTIQPATLGWLARGSTGGQGK
jgi:hypothetical protein